MYHLIAHFEATLQFIRSEFVSLININQICYYSQISLQIRSFYDKLTPLVVIFLCWRLYTDIYIYIICIYIYIYIFSKPPLRRNKRRSTFRQTIIFHTIKFNVTYFFQ